MGFLSHLLYPWLYCSRYSQSSTSSGDGLGHVLDLHHPLSRPLGAAIYILVEVIPDAGLLGQSFKVFPRRKRIQELETMVRDNPSSGNYEELGDLYMDDGRLLPARVAFDKAIAARADTLDPFYRRGVCALLLGDAAAA